jgi:hypothetical protein
LFIYLKKIGKSRHWYSIGVSVGVSVLVLLLLTVVSS